YEAQERHADLSEILQRKLDLASDGASRHDIEFRLGQLYEHHLLGIERAIEYYQSILMQDPTHENAIAALEGLLADEGYRLAASRVLEPIYSDQEEFAKLVELLELQLLDTQDPPAQVDLLRRIATLRQTRLGEAEGAFDAWSRAMRIDPSSEFQERLEDLTSITGDFEQLVAVYKEGLPNLFDPPRMVELRLRIAQICGNRLDDDAGAEAVYLAA